MPGDQKPARLSAAAYRAQFTPAPHVEPEVVVIPNDDEEEPCHTWF
jgi:hypothetical protein